MKTIINFLTKLIVFFVPERFKHLVNYETVSYLLFGGLTTLVSFGSFIFFVHVLGIGTATATTASNIVGIIFAFFPNKIYVFESPGWRLGILIPEIVKFGSSRAFTTAFQAFAMVVLVDIWGFHGGAMWIVTAVVIQIVGNYVLGKWLVFAKEGDGKVKRTTIFILMLLLMAAAFIGAFWLGRGRNSESELEPDYTPLAEHYEPSPTPAPPDTDTYVSEDNQSYPEYEPHDPDYEYTGDTSSPWHPIHFSNIRPAQPLDENTPYGYVAMHHIKYLNDNFYSRFPFSYQEKRAAAWIVQELLAMGYTWDCIQVQEFSWGDVSQFTWGNFERFATFGIMIDDYNYLRDTHLSQNVILTVPGQSDQVIVIGAHYDTVLYPGASDNASGTALLLESAQRMLSIDNYYTLVYIFFGAEEIGLLGAYYYVDALTDAEIENILFMVNADVLFEGPNFIYAAGYRGAGGRTSANDITHQWDELALELRARGEEIYVYPDPDSIYLGSDHLAFKDAGVTVMMMFGGYLRYDGSMYFRVLHSYRDCWHYIMENWPDKIGDSMRTFSVFLEEILLARY